MTTTWRETAGKTTMRIVIELASAEVRDMVVKTGMAGGMAECYDVLDRMLSGR